MARLMDVFSMYELACVLLPVSGISDNIHIEKTESRGKGLRYISGMGLDLSFLSVDGV